MLFCMRRETWSEGDGSELLDNLPSKLVNPLLQPGRDLMRSRIVLSSLHFVCVLAGQKSGKCICFN